MKKESGKQANRKILKKPEGDLVKDNAGGGLSNTRVERTLKEDEHSSFHKRNSGHPGGGTLSKGQYRAGCRKRKWGMDENDFEFFFLGCLKGKVQSPCTTSLEKRKVGGFDITQ